MPRNWLYSLCSDLKHNPVCCSLISDFDGSTTEVDSSIQVYYILRHLFIAVNGLLILAWPASFKPLFRDEVFVGEWVPCFSGVIGTFSDDRRLVLFLWRQKRITVIRCIHSDRSIILVPAVLIPVALAVFPHVLLIFGILDPILEALHWVVPLASDKS